MLDSLRAAAFSAKQLHCDALVILGDLFDTERPEPQIIAAVQNALRDDSIEKIFLVGNHDQVSVATGDHTLGPLSDIGTVVEEPTCVSRLEWDTDLLLVPFRPGPAVEWFPDTVIKLAEQPSKKRKILGMHLGISDDATPPWLKNAPDSIPVDKLLYLCNQFGIDFAAAGNWHANQVWDDGCIVTQVGALCATGFDNEGLRGYGCLSVWDSINGYTNTEIPGPRFIKFSSADLFYRNLDDIPALSFVKITALPNDKKKAQDLIEEAKLEGKIFDGCVETDLEDDKVAARTAATVARSAETLEEALALFIANMPLPEGVNREHIVERARKYLAGGT